MMESLQKIGACLLLGALAGCGVTPSFDSPDSAARIAAIRQTAERNDRSKIPRLIEMLDSDDPAVRLLAIRTLEDMTQQTLGYEYWQPAYKRADAVDRWQLWWQSQQSGAAAGGDQNTNTAGDSSASDDPGAAYRKKEGAAGSDRAPGGADGLTPGTLA